MSEVPWYGGLGGPARGLFSMRLIRRMLALSGSVVATTKPEGLICPRCGGDGKSPSSDPFGRGQCWLCIGLGYVDRQRCNDYLRAQKGDP